MQFKHEITRNDTMERRRRFSTALQLSKDTLKVISRADSQLDSISDAEEGEVLTYNG